MKHEPAPILMLPPAAHWRLVSERPDLMHQPGRQFIRIEGSKYHSGVRWARAWIGEAFIRTPGCDDELLQYRKADILRLCRDGDIDLETAEVTHWMPAQYPAFPSARTERKPPIFDVVTGSAADILMLMFGPPQQDNHVMRWRWHLHQRRFPK